MSFPTQEWQSKLQKQVEETQKIVGHYESVCESKKVGFNAVSCIFLWSMLLTIFYRMRVLWCKDQQQRDLKSSTLFDENMQKTLTPPARIAIVFCFS